MRIQSIGQYEAVVSVSADDCMLLARACNIAAEVIGGQNGNNGEQTNIVAYTEALGAAFKATAIAGLAQWDMSRSAIVTLEEAMKQLDWNG